MASAAIQAQELRSAYFTDGFITGHTMNPARGNENNYVAIPVINNIGIEAQGNFKLSQFFLDNPLYPSQSSHKKVTFMNSAIPVDEALKGFSKGNNRLNADLGITLLSTGFKGFGGYNTIELNAKTHIGLVVPYAMFEFAKNIDRKSYNLGNSYASALGYAEIALGHSRQLTEQLRIGAKLKVLLGAARADIALENMKADLSGKTWTVEGQATADLSMKGLNVLKDGPEQSDDKRKYYDIDDYEIDKPGIGGFGLAVDLGAIYTIGDTWELSAALSDLGFISWSNDQQLHNPNEKIEFKGFHDINEMEDGHTDYMNYGREDYADQLDKFTNIKYIGDKGSRTTGIGATLTAGARYTLQVYKPLSFGLLSTTRINGNHSWTEGRLSANYAPLSWLDGGVSVAVNSFAASCGWVLNIHPKGYNLFLGMNHIIGKLNSDYIPMSPNASINMGMNISF